MALLFCDSFDHYTTSATVDCSTTFITQKWTVKQITGSDSKVGTNFGRFGTSGWGQNNSGNYLRRSLGVQATELYFGAAVSFLSNASPILIPVFQLWDGSTVQCSIRRTTGGNLAAYRGSTLLGTSVSVYTAGVTRYIEGKVILHGSTGAVTIRVDGVDVLTLTGQNTLTTANVYADGISIGGDGSTDSGNSQESIDDFYVADNTTATNNTFFGDVRIQALFPTAAGSNTQLSRVGGASNQASVNEVAADSDTTYVYSNVAGQKDTYNFGDLTPTAGTIKAVQAVAFAKKDDAGGRVFCIVYRSAGVDNDGANITLASSYTYALEIKTLNPTTGSAWTVADINAAEFGVKVVT